MKNTDQETPGDGNKSSAVCTLCKTLNRPSHRCCLQRLWRHVESTARMQTTEAAACSRPRTSATRMLPVKSHPSSRHGTKQTSTWIVDQAAAESAFQSWEHMKLRGRVKAREVMVLIDSGCTHNFISSKVVRALNLKTTALDPYVVHLPDGSNQLWNRQVKSIPLLIQTYYDLLSFGIMDLEHIDVILGQQWLYAKDPKISFRNHTVELDHNGTRHKLLGERGLPDTSMVTGH